jgi:branched-chain amino acid transport system substrate-binding protein
MKTVRHLRTLVILVVTLSLLALGFNGVAAMHAVRSEQHETLQRLKGKIIIGQITSLTGPFSIYGVMEVQGFRIGLEYATHGTMKVDGARIVVREFSDASGPQGLPDPATAVTDAKDAILNDHADILQCCASSASAIAVAHVAAQYKKILMVAPAAADELSGINRYTFRTSREDSQDAITGAAYAMHRFGNTYMGMAQDYAFGHDQVATWTKQLDRLHATNLGDVFFPLTATDFTPYIQQVLSKRPKWLFVACAGEQCLGLWKQLNQQGLLDQIHVMTGLPDNKSIQSFDGAGPKMGFMSVYYYTFPHTRANDYLVTQMQKQYHRTADIFDQDAFAAAQQLVAAIKKTHSVSATKLIHALEGQTVNGPKGKYTIRKQDHVCLQPMYIAKLVAGSDNTLKPILLKTKSPKATAPPIQAHF